MRNFFLGDEIFTSCGSRSGPKEGGWVYFCTFCGKSWGRVELGCPATTCEPWRAVHIPCALHGKPNWGPAFTGGSFLYPLIWWDFANGNSLALQLAQASPELIYYEASIRVPTGG